MPNVTAKEAGDNFYPQYNVVTREPVSNITITKGRLYTKGGGANGNQLVAVGAAGFIRGIYQAAASIETAGEAGENHVQCYTTRSRVGLPAKTANLHAGDLVKYDIANHNVELWTGSTSAATAELAGIVGRIYKIYTMTDITVEKDVTAVGDIVIVDLYGVI